VTGGNPGEVAGSAEAWASICNRHRGGNEFAGYSKPGNGGAAEDPVIGVIRVAVGRVSRRWRATASTGRSRQRGHLWFPWRRRFRLPGRKC